MKRTAVALALVVAASTVEAAPKHRFAGSWSGGPATCAEPFRFTDSRYTPPGAPSMRIRKIEREGNDYLLSFPDGYTVSLFDVGPKTMIWHSPTSGDTFDLRRCR